VASATPAATVEPTPSAPDEPVAGWEEAATFGAEGTIERAQSLARTSDGLIAVGTHYGVEVMPHSGPVPQEGRVWHSADGRTWEDVTPSDTFADADLTHVWATADDALIAVGGLAEGGEGAAPMAWESTDGRSWSPTSLGLTGYWRVDRLVHGARGYLALISVGPEIYTVGDRGLWLSADGRTWELVRPGAPATAEQFIDIGAGDDGFAATGTRGDAFEPFAIASSDGRTWIEATVPSAGIGMLAERGGDWIAMGGAPRGPDGPPKEASVWSSANGLEWAEVGSIPLYPAASEPDGTVVCSDFIVDLLAAGPWLISNAAAGYGLCSEGRIETYGTQSISRDGRAWEVLPFPSAYDGGGSRGSQVNGAVVEGNVLILIGHAGSRAMFWFNEAP
jgi:hypothetical protein